MLDIEYSVITSDVIKSFDCTIKSYLCNERLDIARLLVKSAYPQKKQFLISQSKHMLCVLTRTVSMKWYC